MSGRTASGRKIIKRACDGCKIRKIKCSEFPPCHGCTAADIPCTFKKTPGTRGPRKLRPKTIQQINQRQNLYTDNGVDSPARGDPSPDARSTPLPGADIAASRDPLSVSTSRTSVASLVLRLCVYRLRLFPVWPIVAVEDIISSLQRDEGNEETYALANALGAATMAQLKLDSSSDMATATSMEAECQRARASKNGDHHASLDSLRISFFLHVYYENQDAGGVQSLLYLREALTLAQIMRLHKETTYAALPSGEQEIRRRIIWLLFVTERGVAMLHSLPVILKCNTQFPSTDGDDGSHILAAFRKLVHLFWIFDKSGAFDMLQNADADGFNFGGTYSAHEYSLDLLQQRLQDVPIDWESSNDVQRADICVTRQWMRAVLWKASLNRNSNLNQVTSPSHPIQIAREFLAVISKLPTTAIEAHGPSIEFKIYEIASAVTDAIANNMRGWRSSENARDILSQLHRILASCRGGNITLASMLYLKIAQIQDRQTLLLEPTSRIEELCEQWPDQMNTPTGLSFEVGNSYRTYSPLRLPEKFQNNREDGNVIPRRTAEGLAFDFVEFQSQLAPDAQDLSWTSTVSDGLASTIGNSSNLYEQLQNFDGFFGGPLTSDTLDVFLSGDEAFGRDC